MAAPYPVGIIYTEDAWHYRLAGFVPYTDAAPYFGQISAWPDSHFNLMTSRRPMNAVIHIFEFQLGGFSLLGMFFVQPIFQVKFNAMSLVKSFLSKYEVSVAGLLFIKIVCTLFAGVFSGFLFGQSALGKYFPGLVSLAFLACTALAILSALGIKSRLPKLNGNSNYLIALLFCSTVLGSSISAGCIYAEDDWHYRLAGYLPFTDASPYFRQVISWPEDSFNFMASFRPLNSVLHMVLFHLGGSSLLGMFFIGAMLAAAAIASFAEALGALVGKAAAWAATCLLLYWSWPYASMVMTELNGITLSAAGFALIFHGLKSPARNTWLTWGAVGLTMANVCRTFNPLAPAFFTLVFSEKIPAFKSRLYSGLALTILILGLFFGLSKTVYGLYGHPESGSQGNFSATLLGLARGTNFAEATIFTIDTYPDVTPGVPSEQKQRVFYFKREVNDKMLEVLWPTIRENPMVFIGSLMRGLKGALQGLYYKTMRAAGLGILAMNFWTAGFIAFYTVLALMLVLLFRSKIAWILALSLLSFFSFAPVIYTDGDWRVAAPLYPGLALLGVLLPLAVGSLRNLSHGKLPAAVPLENEKTEAVKPAWVGTAQVLIVMVFLSIPYPWVFRKLHTVFGNGEPHYLFTLAIDAGQQPGWTGLNSAVISPERLRRWFEQGGALNFNGMESNADFVEKHGERLRALVLEKGGIAMVFKDSVALRSFPDQSGVCSFCPVYQLRVQD